MRKVVYTVQLCDQRFMIYFKLLRFKLYLEDNDGLRNAFYLAKKLELSGLT